MGSTPGCVPVYKLIDFSLNRNAYSQQQQIWTSQEYSLQHEPECLKCLTLRWAHLLTTVIFGYSWPTTNASA